jgi:hypothetical protein
MNEFYDFHKRLSDYILTTGLVNKVTWGDIFDLDIEKRNEYALAHIMYQSITPSISYNTVQVDIILADMVNDSFDNTLDVMNAMAVLGTMLYKSFDGGDLYDFGYRIEAPPTMEVFKERNIMNLAGFSVSMSVTYPNNITRCN